jgi:hypothetical protein
MRLLVGQVSQRKARIALDKLPENLNHAYDKVWDRIFSQGEDRETIARVALVWTTYAKEPLTVEMLLYVIALSLHPELETIEEEDFIDVELLLSSCAGLLILNREVGFIRLVHNTTQDYLEIRLPKDEANTSIARVCLRYFGLRGSLKWDSASKMFQGYAAEYWHNQVLVGTRASSNCLTLHSVIKRSETWPTTARGGDDLSVKSMHYNQRMPPSFTGLHDTESHI